ncbi:MAG: hypothetical protein EBR01_14610 [Proteobacteria bacterium]|nr:hypothetical protein [Pseudomonadota bacterium]
MYDLFTTDGVQTNQLLVFKQSFWPLGRQTSKKSLVTFTSQIRFSLGSGYGYVEIFQQNCIMFSQKQTNFQFGIKEKYKQ